MKIVIQYFDNSLENVAEVKIEVDIPEADEWVERIDKTAYKMCNNNRIKQKASDTDQCTGPIALSCIGWAIEKHLDDIPSTSQLFKKFWKIQESKKKI